MIQLVDQWLEDNPDADLDYITFTDTANAAFPGMPKKRYQKTKYDEEGKPYLRLTDGIMLGEQIFDPASNSERLFSQKDRNNDVFATFPHEYEHLSDDRVRQLDRRKIRKIISNNFDQLLESSLGEKALNYAKKKVDKNNLGKIKYSEFEINYYEGVEDLKFFGDKEGYKILVIENEIVEEYKKISSELKKNGDLPI